MMAPEYQYRKDQELPVMAFEWADSDGVALAFATGWTFTAKIARSSAPAATLLTKTANISGADAFPNVLVAWSTTDFSLLDAVAGGTDYVVHLYARRTSDSKDDVFRPGDLPRFRLHPAAS